MFTVDLRQASVGSRRRHVALCRIAHIQRLMRSLVVEAADEIIELALLLKKVVAGRLG
jgi:hypothetical protein